MASSSLLKQNIYYSAMIGASGLVSSAFYATSDRMALSFGGSALSAGYFVAAWAAGSFSGNILWGWVADKMGKPRVVAIACLLLACGLLVAALAPFKALALAGLFLMGLGFSPAETMSSALLTDHNPGSATRWMNLSQVCFCLGALAAPILAVWYYTGLGRPFKELFLILAVLMLASVLFAPRERPKTDAAAPCHTKGSPFTVLDNRRFVTVCLLVFTYVGCESLLTTYLKQYFLLAGSSEAVAASMISVFWFFMILSRIIGAWMNGKEVESTYIFGAIMMAGILLLLFAPAPWLRYAATALLGVGCGPIWCSLYVLGGREYPRRSGAAFSVMTMFSASGGVLFPVVFGSWPGNLRITFWLFAGMVLVLAALLTVYKKTPGPAA